MLRKILFLGFILFWIGFVPLRLAIAHQQYPQPQAILLLEGHRQRIPFAAEFWNQHPTLPIWFTGSRTDRPRNQRIFQQAGVPAEMIHYDRRSTDTVTNFTAIVRDLVRQDIHHVFLITSDYHMPRASAIATLVLGSQGIVFTPVSVPTSPPKQENQWRTLRDCLRSVLWMVTGVTGASLRSYFQPNIALHAEDVEDLPQPQS
uniref:DUF218 domain-containing protein n=1 Tax=Cyanothece sp. (strain PCC 7425 / ATCC 29141) TaxID=395961 RepID=B8HPU3_CYAP4